MVTSNEDKLAFVLRVGELLGFSLVERFNEMHSARVFAVPETVCQQAVLWVSWSGDKAYSASLHGAPEAGTVGSLGRTVEACNFTIGKLSEERVAESIKRRLFTSASALACEKLAQTAAIHAARMALRKRALELLHAESVAHGVCQQTYPYRPAQNIDRYEEVQFFALSGHRTTAAPHGSLRMDITVPSVFAAAAHFSKLAEVFAAAATRLAAEGFQAVSDEQA